MYLAKTARILSELGCFSSETLIIAWLIFGSFDSVPVGQGIFVVVRAIESDPIRQSVHSTPQAHLSHSGRWLSAGVDDAENNYMAVLYNSRLNALKKHSFNVLGLRQVCDPKQRAAHLCIHYYQNLKFLECSDQRDKIYGLLGLLPHHGVKVNYDQTLSQLFFDTLYASEIPTPLSFYTTAVIAQKLKLSLQDLKHVAGPHSDVALVRRVRETVRSHHRQRLYPGYVNWLFYSQGHVVYILHTGGRYELFFLSMADNLALPMYGHEAYSFAMS